MRSWKGYKGLGNIFINDYGDYKREITEFPVFYMHLRLVLYRV